MYREKNGRASIWGRFFLLEEWKKNDQNCCPLFFTYPPLGNAPEVGELWPTELLSAPVAAWEHNERGEGGLVVAAGRVHVRQQAVLGRAHDRALLPSSIGGRFHEMTESQRLCRLS